MKLLSSSPSRKSTLILADASDIFYFFFCSGRGKGESEAAGRGVRFFIENPRRGGGVSRRGRGAGRVSVANWGFWERGGGAKYFFFRAEMSTKL